MRLHVTHTLIFVWRYRTPRRNRRIDQPRTIIVGWLPGSAERRVSLPDFGAFKYSGNAGDALKTGFAFHKDKMVGLVIID